MKKIFTILFCLIFVSIFFVAAVHYHETEENNCSLCFSAAVFSTAASVSCCAILLIYLVCVFLLHAYRINIPKPVFQKISNRSPPEI